MRTRTPPELKWLLVERATLAGDLASLKARHSLLETEIDQVQSTLQALDTTIRLTEARARPDAAGVVRRHQPKYGQRGALKAFVVEALQAEPAGLTTREVALAAAAHFGLPFVSEADFLIYLNNTVRAQLNKLAGAGRAPCGGRGSGACLPLRSWRCWPTLPHRSGVRLMATKTRPDIKWLINETAMLQGELERIDQEMARLVALRAAVERSRAACQRTLEYQAGRKVPGLPTVRAHRQYGRRGDLQQFLANTLRDLAPAQLNTAQLAERALVQFDLAMSCPAELYDFKMNTVGRALRRLLALGVIERLTTEHRVDRALGAWRWKAEVASFGELGLLVADAMATAGSDRSVAVCEPKIKPHIINCSQKV